MGSVLSEIVIDSKDAPELARWWGRVLDWPVTDREGYSWISADGRPDTAPVLVFVPVADDKTGKNRMHIDVSPSGTDQEGELARLLELGARRTDVGQGDDVSWIVLADPEGNEFCLLRG